MKTVLVLALALGSVAPASAQIFRPSAFGGIELGAVTGAIIGRNSGSLGHDAWRGAAYGAAAGLLLDSALGRADYGYAHGWNRPYRHAAPRVYVYRDAPVVYSDYGQGYDYDYAYDLRPDYRNPGLWLGGLVGAIIGRNSGSLGHNAWRGAAYGAGLGYLLGAVAENNARRPAVIERPAPAPVQPPPPVTIVNNYYNTQTTPMSAANSLFGR